MAAAQMAVGDDIDHDRLDGARVLLVEDDEINQQVAKLLLEKKGIAVDLVTNGAEAVAAVQRQPYDLVLMDCQMPVMDGYAATKAIRQLENCKTLPIIAMTANALHGDYERSLSAGMNDHIGKPINVAKLYDTLARWLPPPRH